MSIITLVASYQHIHVRCTCRGLTFIVFLDFINCLVMRGVILFGATITISLKFRWTRREIPKSTAIHWLKSLIRLSAWILVGQHSFSEFTSIPIRPSLSLKRFTFHWWRIWNILKQTMLWSIMPFLELMRRNIRFCLLFKDKVYSRCTLRSRLIEFYETVSVVLGVKEACYVACTPSRTPSTR